MIIEWKNAPDWAIAHALYAYGGELYEVWVGEDKYQRQDHPMSFPYGGTAGDCYHNPRRYQFKYETPRPVPWNGEGLPPVGVPIEMKHKDATEGWARPDFCEETLVWIGKKRFMTADEMVGDIASYLFRPIRTPEQIAAEDRLKAIDEMADVYKSNYEGHVKDGCQALYDAGYRKQVKP